MSGIAIHARRFDGISPFRMHPVDNAAMATKYAAMNRIATTSLDKLKLDANGLIPAIIQDHRTGQVLMMAWMNHEALEKTLETRQTHFFSRSRNKLWLKGESSGHVQNVKSIAVDCDQDVLLVKVEQIGAACHEGYGTCFFREFDPESDQLKVVEKRVFDPKSVYGKA